MRSNMLRCAVAALSISVWTPSCGHAADGESAAIKRVVSRTIAPLMQRYGIPGMAVGVVTDSGGHVYDFGVMSKATGAPVTHDTLFEIGSISKAFTATLAAYAEVAGRLSMSDPVSKHLSALRGSRFGSVSLLELGTHTPGGMPIQFPDDVRNDDEAMRYFQDWTPAYAPGTVRTYANPSIGLLGVIAAGSLNDDFSVAMDRWVFRPLGLRRTWLDVPDAERVHYAQGYTRTDAPTRMSPGPLATQAYGVRTTAGDLLRFVRAQMGLLPVDGDLRRAIAATHAGYHSVGAMTQDLIWEQYRFPVDLKDLLAGNSAKVSFEPNPVVRIDPPAPPRDDVLINKTGSTNGFGAYVAFVPAQRIGVVLLANKNYPIDARVTAAYGILTALIGDRSGD
jgi:beta-lactamase class C